MWSIRSGATDIEIQHDADGFRFFTEKDGHTAMLSYRLTRDAVMELNHTFTPPSIRGHGIAAELVEQAVAFARSNGYRIIPYCSYVTAYLKRHPEHQDVVAVR